MSAKITLDASVKDIAAAICNTRPATVAEALSTINTEYPEARDAFTNLYDKLYMQFVRDNGIKAYYDDFFDFIEAEPIPYGTTISQVFVDRAEALAFDPTGANAMNRDTTSTTANHECFMGDLVPEVYKKTVQDTQYRAGVTSIDNLNALSNQIIGALAGGERKQRFADAIQRLGMYLSNGYAKVWKTSRPDSEAGVKTFLADLRNAIFTLKGYGKNNKEGVINPTPDDEIYVLLPYGSNTYIDVNFLAGVWNLDKVEISGHIKYMPIENSFGTLVKSGDTSTVQAVVCSRRWMGRHMREHSMETQRNAEGKFTNYYLHDFNFYSCSALDNAIVLTDSTQTIALASAANVATYKAGSSTVTTAIPDTAITVVAGSAIDWTTDNIDIYIGSAGNLLYKLCTYTSAADLANTFDAPFGDIYAVESAK